MSAFQVQDPDLSVGTEARLRQSSTASRFCRDVAMLEDANKLNNGIRILIFEPFSDANAMLL